MFFKQVLPDSIQPKTHPPKVTKTKTVFMIVDITFTLNARFKVGKDGGT